MKIPRLVPLLMMAAVCCGAVARAQDPQTVEVTLTPQLKMALQVPAGWVRMQDPDTGGKTIAWATFGPGAKMTDVFALNVNFRQDTAGRLQTVEQLDAVVERMNEDPAKEMGGQKVLLVEIKSKAGHGSYGVVTDPQYAGVEKVPDGHFRCLVSGAFAYDGGVVMGFTLATNDVKGAVFQQMLKMIQEGIAVEPAH